MTLADLIEYFDVLDEKVLIQNNGNLIAALRINVDDSLFVEEDFQRLHRVLSILFRKDFTVYALYRKTRVKKEHIQFYSNGNLNPTVDILKRTTQKYLARLGLFREETYIFVQMNLSKKLNPSPLKLFLSKVDLAPLFQEALSSMHHFLRSIEEAFSSIKGASAKTMKAEEVASLIYSLLHLGEDLPPLRLNPNTFLFEQLCDCDLEADGSFLRVNGSYATVLSLSVLPPETDSDFFAALRRFESNMWITQSFTPISSAILSLKIGPLTNAAEKLATYSFLGPLAEKARRFAEMNQEIFEKVEGGEVPVEFSQYIVLFGKDRAALEEVREKIISRFLEEKAGFAVENLNLLPAFLSSIPGNPSHDARRKIILSPNACDFFCAYRNCDGHERAVAYFVTPEKTLFKVDPFSPIYPAWNFYVVGSTGAGKSFFMNYILMNSLVYDPYVFILDYGESYRTVVEFFNIPILTIAKEQENSVKLNPFAIKRFDEDSLQYLVLFVESLVKEEGRYSLEERVDISQAIKQMFERRGVEFGQEIPPDFDKPTLSDLYVYLKEINPRLAKRLKLWLRGELYGRYFDHKEDNFSFSRIQYIEMTGFDKDDRLSSPLIFTLFYKIFETITTIPPGEKKLVLMDEVWKFLLNRTMADKTQEIFRTIRKFGGLIGIITQHPADLLNSEYRDAILANIYITYFLKQERVYEEWKTTFSMNEREFEEIKSLQMVKGQYSEIMFWSGAIRKKIRLTVNPLLYWMFTTNPYEKEKRRRYIEKYGLKEGLIKLVEESVQ